MNALYVHIPFCEKKCLFCSFAVAVGQKHKVDEYLECLALEAEKYKGTRVGTIYTGGGTPTFLDIGQLRTLGKIIRGNFLLDKNAEVTIEANPEGIDPAKAKAIVDLGFNRVSLGVQSVQEKYLKLLGRCHGRAQAVTAFENFRKAGCRNINLDLMYSFPQQTPDEIDADVQFIASLNSEHVSIYTLTVEENSRFYAQKLKQDGNDVQAKQFEQVTGALEKSGLRQYEISNFARGGHESLHNINYWAGGNYIGLGVGAHSHQDGKRSWNTARLMDYLAGVRPSGSAVGGGESLSGEERFVETLLFGLRMNRGIDVASLERDFKIILDDARREKVQRFITEGLLVQDGKILKASAAGRLVLDELSAQLI